MLKVLFSVFLVGGGSYLLVALYFYLNQRRFEYFPTTEDAKGEGGAGFEAWRSSEGEFLGYWRPTDKPKRLVILFHGNGGEALHRSWIAELLPSDQLVFLAEYPGYGAKEGKPDQASILAAALRSYDSLTARWKLPVTLVGESLGSAVACYVASERSVEQLALISPLPSVTALAAYHYPFFPVGLLLKDTFNTKAWIPKVKVPLHVIHGTLDEIVPVKFGRQLFDSYSGTQKEFIEIPGFGHNNIVDAITDSPFAEKFRMFISGN